MPSAPLEIIAAVDDALGIGRDGALPWSLPADLAMFRRLTTQSHAEKRPRNAVVMGRRTWASIPLRFRPLPGRVNVLLSRTPARWTSLTASFSAEDVFIAGSLDEACQRLPDPHRIFIIGGAELYAEAAQHPLTQQLHLTRVEGAFCCDVRFPFDPTHHPERWSLQSRSAQHEDPKSHIKFHFERWSRP